MEKFHFTRDNFKCIWCDKKGDIEADHIVKFTHLVDKNNIKTIEDAEKCDELWDINNGRTLCHDCHKKTDTYGARGGTYRG